MSTSNSHHPQPGAAGDSDALPPRASDVDAISDLYESYKFHGDIYTPAEHVWQELPIPVLDATKDPDIRRLRGLLNDGRFPATCITAGPLGHVGWQSALNTAIERQIPAHARLLVEAGAEVNGFPVSCFSCAASRFVRGRPPNYTRAAPLGLPDVRKKPAGSDVGNQMRHGLTDAELETRRAGRARFWAEPDFPRIDFPGGSATSSLTVAARVGDTDLYEFLVAHGADESAWLQQTTTLDDAVAISMLAAESPLHAAVVNQDASMLQFLLDHGHKPDVFPSLCQHVA